MAFIWCIARSIVSDRKMHELTQRIDGDDARSAPLIEGNLNVPTVAAGCVDITFFF